MICYTASLLANTSDITHYIVPPASKLNWNNDKSLIKSFISSYMNAINYGYKNADRKSIGHVVTKIRCGNQERYTSISINSLRLLPSILRNGITGLFKPTPGAHIQESEEILRFLYENHKNLNFMKFTVGLKECKELLSLDNELRKAMLNDQYFFGPTLTDIHTGGTGASYAVAMLDQLKLLSNDQITKWSQIFKTSHKTYEFYDSMKMWSYVNNNTDLFQKVGEKLRYKNFNLKLYGLQIRSK